MSHGQVNQYVGWQKQRGNGKTSADARPSIVEVVDDMSWASSDSVRASMRANRRRDTKLTRLKKIPQLCSLKFPPVGGFYCSDRRVGAVAVRWFWVRAWWSRRR